jgi:hypothetical protein
MLKDILLMANGPNPIPEERGFSKSMLSNKKLFISEGNIHLARGVAGSPANEGQAVERQSYASLDEYL